MSTIGNDMKQTIDDLSRYGIWYIQKLTDVDDAIRMRLLRNATGWAYFSQHCRDSAFMNALTSKAGLPYQAKLIALQMER